ncbi:MAG: alpha-L-fucosidase [Tepidisphaeraceae bacterium]
MYLSRRPLRLLILAVALALLPRVARAQSGPPVTPEIVAAAAAAKTPIADGPVQPTWDSIRANYTVPQWFIDAKFGITMHWGLFSVAAYHNEWYEKYMYSTFATWHTQHFGPPDKFGYKDFIPLFTAKDFNADDLLALVKESGAKYFMPTCEHHDGFSLWDSAINPFNAAQLGPKRDLIGEMAVATRKAGLKFGVCNHSIEHYTFVNPTPGLKTDLDDPKYADFYWTNHSDARLQQFLENWVSKSMELIDKYQLDILWYDNGVNSRNYDPLKEKVAAYFYNRARQWGKEVTIDTKSTAFLAGSVLDFEKLNPRGPTRILKGIWDAEEPIGSTWGYSAANPVETFRGPQSVISELCEVLSMNGNLLLNLSPDGQGAISAPQQNTLREIGKWLAVNGEAVYGTHSWTTDGEGFAPAAPRNAGRGRRGANATTAPSAAAAPAMPAGPRGVVYRFTVKGDNLYALAQSWPGDTAVITSLATGKSPEGKIESVTLLGHDGNLEFTQDDQGLKVKMPAQRPCNYAYSLKITGLKMNPAGPPVPAVMADLR